MLLFVHLFLYTHVFPSINPSFQTCISYLPCLLLCVKFLLDNAIEQLAALEKLRDLSHRQQCITHTSNNTSLHVGE